MWFCVKKRWSGATLPRLGGRAIVSYRHTNAAYLLVGFHAIPSDVAICLNQFAKTDSSVIVKTECDCGKSTSPLWATSLDSVVRARHRRSAARNRCSVIVRRAPVHFQPLFRSFQIVVPQSPRCRIELWPGRQVVISTLLSRKPSLNYATAAIRSLLGL